MRWLNALTGSQNDPVRVVQRALSEYSDMSLHTMIDALDEVVREQLWQVGRPFDSFAEFAIALASNRFGGAFVAALEDAAIRPACQRQLCALD